jgi:hypothetical protein
MASSLVRVFSLASVANLLDRDPPGRLTHNRSRPDRGQQPLCLGRGEVLPGATRDELGEQPVQPVHGLHPPRRQLVAPIHQQPQRRLMSSFLNKSPTDTIDGLGAGPRRAISV